MNVHQQVSGKYSFYTQDAHGNSTLHSEADNLITNAGMDQVSNITWADCFKAVAVGTGTNSPSFADTTLQTPVLSAFYSSGAHGQGYYIRTMTDDTTILYKLGRPYLITNNTGTTQSITEVATMSAMDAGAARGIFSRALLPSPITLAPNATVGIIYELRLTISSLSSTGITTFNGGALGSQISAITRIPINYINAFGDTAVNGYNILEPSTTKYLGYSYAATAAEAAANYAAYVNSDDGVIEALSLHLGTFTRQTYINGSYKVIHSYIISPGIMPSTVKAFTIKPGGGGQPNYTYSTVFVSGTYPYYGNFTKIHFELSWARA